MQLYVLALLILVPALQTTAYRFALLAKWATHPFFLAAEEGCIMGALELGDTECLFLGPKEGPDGFEQVR